MSGWIDKVYVDYVGQLVKKGQPLFTLYSPDLVATQEEYLIAKRGQAALGGSPFQEVSDGSNSLLRASRDRLKLWDITDEQIKKLDETGEVTKNLTFYSPTTGFVTDRKAFPQTSVTSDTGAVHDLRSLNDLGQPGRLRIRGSLYPRGTRRRTATQLLPRTKWHGQVSYILPDGGRTVAHLESPHSTSES